MRGDQHVADILAREKCRDFHAIGQNRGHVLHGVNRDVDGVFGQAGIEFFGKQALPADFREWPVLDLIAGGFHHRYSEAVLGQAVGGHQAGADLMGLRECQRGAAGANAQHRVPFKPI